MIIMRVRGGLGDPDVPIKVCGLVHRHTPISDLIPFCKVVPWTIVEPNFPLQGKGAQRLAGVSSYKKGINLLGAF